ncbi:MAG: TolC family protein [Fibrobacteria bacterium]|nr:TolC family protein [Fibrobacteria bacterium]
MKFLCIILSILGLAHSFNEYEAVQMALEKSPNIRVSTINLTHDSLNQIITRSDAAVQAEVSGNNIIEAHPATRMSYGDNSTTSNSIESSAGGTISKYLPGGGQLSASVTGAVSKNLDSSGSSVTTTTGVTAIQPLLKDAWSNAPIDYEIEIGKKNLAKSFEKFKSDVLEILTEVRNSYLDWLGATRTVAIREMELNFTTEALEYEKARFSLGEKAEMDTLSGALELLRAKEKLLSAAYEERAAKRQLALELGISPEDLPPLTDSLIEVNTLPSENAILAQINKHDYELKLLDIGREILEMQQKKYGNALLPRLDVKAGVSNVQHGSMYFSGSDATASRPNVLDPWVGINFSYDIFSRKARYQKKQAVLSLKSNNIERTYALNQQKSEISDFLDAWKQDEARLSIRRSEIKIAERNYEYAVQRYELGEIDNLVKLKARNDLISARLNRLLAEMNLKKLEIAVDKVTANVLNRFGIRLENRQ